MSVLEPLGTNTHDRYLDKNFGSIKEGQLMIQASAPEFSVTAHWIAEHKNVNLPKYAGRFGMEHERLLSHAEETFSPANPGL